MFRSLADLFAPVLALVFVGCTAVQKYDVAAKLPLALLEADSERIALDAVFVRLPPDDEEASESLWREIDEQRIGAELRRSLAHNGFRAGVLGTQLPASIRDLLRSADQPGRFPRGDAGELSTSLASTRHRLYLLSAGRAELITSAVYPKMHALTWKDGQVRGETVEDAQPQFEVRAERTPDGNVEIQIVPELHYGPYRNVYRPGNGMFRIDHSRRKKTFEHLRLHTILSPGQILVVGPRSEQGGSLGNRFFSDPYEPQRVRRLLLLRLRPVGNDPLFSDAGE